MYSLIKARREDESSDQVCAGDYGRIPPEGIRGSCAFRSCAFAEEQVQGIRLYFEQDDFERSHFGSNPDLKWYSYSVIDCDQEDMHTNPIK